MATASSADAWRQGGQGPERSYSQRAPMPGRPLEAERASRPIRTGRPAPMRPADRARAAEERAARGARARSPYEDDAAQYPRTPRRRPEESRPVARGSERGRLEERADRERGGDPREARRPRDRRDPARPADRAAAARPSARDREANAGGRVRGVLAVLLMFVVTIAGAAVDSFVGIGLGLLTLGALTVSTAFAAWLVRRRDMMSVLIAPPLVFLGVAAVNIALAPSATLSLATLAALLIRGFPTMAIATGVALVIGLVRLAARR